MQTIIISALVAYVVSMITIKIHFWRIDRYVAIAK